MPYIYESPDGGHTVYARKILETSREKVHESNHIKTLKDSLAEADLWTRIRIAAKSNPSIADALNHARVLYELSRRDED